MRRAPMATLAIIAILSLPRMSRAQVHGGVNLKLDVEHERNQEPETTNGLQDVSMAGLSIDAYGGGTKGGLAMHVDSHFGAGWQGGFAYRFAFHPVGVSLYDPKHWLTLTCTTGFLLQGVTRHQRFGFLAPIRATLLVDLGDHIQLQGTLSNDFAISDRRDNGSENALFGDEFRASLSIRVGSSGQHGEGPRRYSTHGKGYFLGVTYSERLGADFWGVSLGHGLQMNGTD